MMKNLIHRLVLLLFCSIALPPSGFGQEKPGAIYIIFDASGSMWQKLPDGSFKIATAKQVLQDFVGGDFSGYELAFRAYGHRRKGDCRDSELVVAFGAPEKVVSQLQTFMATVNPTGKTPINFSLRQALQDFGDRSGEIILISDGEETCDDDPCALVKIWREKNVKIRVHVVGLGLDEKSKTAMKCISDAAGTEYYDANSASELADGLKKIQEKATMAALIIQGVDAGGNRMQVEGTLSRDGNKRYDVTSHRRNLVEAGEYVLLAGVRTKNGNLYKPATKTVNVAETGETRVKVEVVVPPSVKARFEDAGKVQRGSLVQAFQNGKQVFKFRWIDEVFLDEGTYEFRAKPNRENELSVTASFAAGDHKEIVFKMVHTVKVKFKMIASGSGIWFRENYELWQNGKRKYKVHAHNGARVLPGTYDLHLTNKLTPYVKPGIVVTDEEEQFFEVTVPVGHVTIIYQKADGTRDKDDRCFIGRGPTGKGKYKMSGKKHPLTPGRYNVTGWRHKGQYNRVVFDLQEGQDIDVVLRAKS
ncbi:MAG: hypothetical protein ACE5IY_22480 [bacterium]